MKLSILLQSVGLFKLMLYLFHMIDIQGRDFFLDDFIKCALNSGLCSDAQEVEVPIFFKLGIMLDVTKLYILIWYQFD